MKNFESGSFKITWTCRNIFLHFHGLFQDHLLPRKSDRDFTWINKLLEEFRNQLLSFSNKSELKLHENLSSTSTIISEKDPEILTIYCWLYTSLFKNFEFCNNEYSYSNISLKNWFRPYTNFNKFARSWRVVKS